MKFYYSGIKIIILPLSYFIKHKHSGSSCWIIKVFLCHIWSKIMIVLPHWSKVPKFRIFKFSLFGIKISLTSKFVTSQPGLQTIAIHILPNNFRPLIQRYGKFSFFRKEPRTSFSTTFCVWFFKKNVSHVILY